MKISLYIHIPFCTRKCLYCDFFSVPLSSGGGEAAAVLEAEIKQLEDFLRVWQPEEISTLYIGGGTPSAVPRPLFAGFLDALSRRLPGGGAGEFSVEANPETLDDDFLSVCAGGGVTRLSLGLQSFNPRFLKYSGRAASPDDNRRALELLARRWTGSLNLDLMYGFPEQKPTELLADAREALAAAPGHLSVYALSVELGTPLFQKTKAGEAAPVNEDRQESLRRKLHGFLSENGYENYEISNYALPGKRCLHNSAYWNLRPYMGIGPAAVSTLPVKPAFAARAGVPEKRRTTALRLSGKPDIAAYTANPCAPEIEKVSPGDFLADYLLMGLRTLDGIDTRAFREIFHFDFSGRFSRAIGKNKRFVRASAGSFTLTDGGRRVLNRILLDFFDDIDRIAAAFTEPFDWP